MAEGFPMGMRAICGAKVMGTMMMGLGAAVYSSKAGGMDFQYSAEPVYNIHGRPRNYFTVSYTHLDVYKRQAIRNLLIQHSQNRRADMQPQHGQKNISQIGINLFFQAALQTYKAQKMPQLMNAKIKVIVNACF